jgi:hypothetical protein
MTKMYGLGHFLVGEGRPGGVDLPQFSLSKFGNFFFPRFRV